MNDYFYGEQIDNFTFYRVPKALFTSPRYKALSSEAKILYGFLLDRVSLSTRNGWKDEYLRYGSAPYRPSRYCLSRAM